MLSPRGDDTHKNAMAAMAGTGAELHVHAAHALEEDQQSRFKWKLGEGLKTKATGK